MDEKIIKFDDTELEKYKFHGQSSPIPISNIDINELVVSKLLFSKQEYLIDCKVDKRIRHLSIFFLNMSTYRSIDKNNCMYFMKKE